MCKHSALRLPSMLHARPDITIPVARGRRKDLAWEDQNPRWLCVCVFNGHHCQIDWPVRGKCERCPGQCLCVYCFFFPVIMLIIGGRNAMGETSDDPRTTATP